MMFVFFPKFVWLEFNLEYEFQHFLAYKHKWKDCLSIA
jgi:hypothetical protein